MPKPSKPPFFRLSLRLDNDLAEALDKYALEHGRLSRSDAIRIAIIALVEKNKLAK
jgi:metal-responsive CopG/Arc/MetJ family transcriptional regulator